MLLLLLLLIVGFINEYLDKTWYSENDMFNWTEELQAYMSACCGLDSLLELFPEWVILLGTWK